jgi:hypothetical protein
VLTVNYLACAPSLQLHHEEGVFRTISFQQMSKKAAERSEEKCCMFWLEIGLNYQVFQLVFVDE